MNSIAAKPVLTNHVLPDGHGIASAAQPQLDGFTIWLAGTGGGEWAGGLECLLFWSLAAGVGGHLLGRFCRAYIGGHLVGWYCRPAPPPCTRRTYRDPGGFEIGAYGFPAHTRALLDAPQRPSEPSQGYNLLLFFFAQDIAHGDRAYLASGRCQCLGRSTVGRFSGDPHWPVLDDH